MGVPIVGAPIQIHSYKHNGHIHRIWNETTVLKGTQNLIIGANDRTLVTESDGRTWITREPAICYFHSQYWFNIIGYEILVKMEFIIIAILALRLFLMGMQ